MPKPIKWNKTQEARFEVKAAAEGPVEISIHGFVGPSYWDDSSVSEHQFLDALKNIANTRELVVRINSQGGSVKDGLGIYNAIKRWQGKTTAHITGFACSIASVIPLACDEVISPKSSLWMIHDPLCYTEGNSADHAKSMEMLETCAATMAAIYSEKTGKTRKQMRDAMSEETWLTGEEAKAFNLVDSTSDDVVDLSAQEIIENYNVPQRLVAMLSSKIPSQAGQPKQEDTMNKKAILALLAEHGKPLAEDAKDEAILAGLQSLVEANKVTKEKADALKVAEPDVLITQAEYRALQAEIKAEKERRVTNEVIMLLADRPQAGKADVWIAQVLTTPSAIEILKNMPIQARDPHTPPVRDQHGGAGDWTGGGNSLVEAYRKFKPGPERQQFALDNWHTLEQAHQQANIRAMSSLPMHEQLRRAMSPRAANTYNASLVTDRLADGVITTIGVKLAALRGFSRDFGVDTLKPRATVQVRKATVASTTLTNATNFEQTDSTTTNVAVSVAQITQPWGVSNDELNKGHQLVQVAQKNAQAFANAISDIWTALLTTANYGTGLSIGAAATFDASDLAPIYAAAKNYGSKNLILDGGHLAYLLPTDKFKFRLGEEGAYNFDLIAEQNRWTGATTNVVGFITDPGAIAVASGLPATLPASEFLELNTVNVPSLDLTVLLTHWFSRGSRSHFMSYDVMFGAAAGDTTAAEILLAA